MFSLSYSDTFTLTSAISKIIDYVWDILLFYLLYDRTYQIRETTYDIIMKNNKNSSGSDEKELLNRQRIGTEQKGIMKIDLAQSEIDRIVTELCAPSSINQLASAIYRRSLSEKVVENRTIADIAAASVYAACKVDNESYNLSDLTNASYTSQRELSQTYADISKDLGLSTGPVDPKTYVGRYCSDLGLTEKEEHYAKEIINEAEPLLSGRSPSGFAAAAVYCAAILTNRKRTQTEVSSVSNVSVETIRDTYQSQIIEISDELSEFT